MTKYALIYAGDLFAPGSSAPPGEWFNVIKNGSEDTETVITLLGGSRNHDPILASIVDALNAAYEAGRADKTAEIKEALGL